MSEIAFDRLTNAAHAVGRVGPVDPSEEAGRRFDALYTVYQPLLRRIAIGKFGIPAADADDLVQDVFATYLANPANVRDLHPYLVGAICNASRQYRRRDDAAPFSPRPEHLVCGATPVAKTIGDPKQTARVPDYNSRDSNHENHRAGDTKNPRRD